MRLIIAGSRSIKDYHVLREAIIDSGLWKEHRTDIVVLSGMARGVDMLGIQFAVQNNCKWEEYPANWDDIKAPGAVVRMQKPTGHLYNAVAGHWRNQEMADKAEALLLVWDGESTGSQDMLTRAERKGLKIYAYRYWHKELTRMKTK